MVYFVGWIWNFGIFHCAFCEFAEHVDRIQFYDCWPRRLGNGLAMSGIELYPCKSYRLGFR